VFTTPATLKAAMALVQGPKLVQVDDSIVSPAVLTAGTYAWDGVTIIGIALSTALTLADGVHFTGNSITFRSVQVTSPATTPIVTVAGLYFIYLNEETQLDMTAGGPFHETLAGGTTVWSTFNSGVGDGVHTVGLTDVGGTTTVNSVFTEIQANAFSGAGTTLFPDDAATVVLPQGAGVVVALESHADYVTYAPATVANWATVAPTSVADALDRVAAANDFAVQNTVGLGPGASVTFAASGTPITQKKNGQVSVGAGMSVTSVGAGAGAISIQLLRDAAVLLTQDLPQDATGKAQGTLTWIDTLPDLLAHTYSVKVTTTVGSVSCAIGRAFIAASEDY
jgi:hypothetical protein